MFDSLARLADGNARRIGLLALLFFLLAGAPTGAFSTTASTAGMCSPASCSRSLDSTVSVAGSSAP